MQKPVSHKIRNNQFWLSTDRTMFWEEEKSLILSDLHFGKTGHFRKSGIAVPAAIFREDLQRLVTQILYYQPRELIIVGDMFHSKANKELELFLKWKSDLGDIHISLVKGNHDILEEKWYSEAGIGLNAQSLTRKNFQFIHDISDSQTGNPKDYFFSGHLHPGIRISGSGRQSLCFPCFYFGKKYAVLPAFSRFTGVALISPGEDEQVYAIVNRELVCLK